MLCQFLLYNVNHLYIYIYHLPLNPPFHLPTPHPNPIALGNQTFMILEDGKCAQGKEITLHFISTVMYVENFVVQSFSCVQLFATPWTAAGQASLSFTISWSLLTLMSIELVMLSNHLILCRLLLLPSVFPRIRVFSSESFIHIRWPKYRSFSFSISPSNEYSGLISFRIDWFDLLAVQGTLKTSLAPQLESIYSSAFSLLYGPALTSIHDYWKNHSFDYIDLCHLAQYSSFSIVSSKYTYVIIIGRIFFLQAK